jgi:hypothetical protein
LTSWYLSKGEGGEKEAEVDQFELSITRQTAEENGRKQT